jgi:CelD/BcsL family acetyltransferase involved in cellulose biosynthesis
LPANHSTAFEFDTVLADAVPKASPELRCEIVTRFVDLERLAPSWNRLWTSDPEAEVFQTFAWNRAWWRANEHNCEVCTPVVWKDDEVAAILPLVKRGDAIQFMAAPEADYADILCEERNTAQCMDLAIRALFGMAGWSECVFEHLSCNSRFVRHWGELPGTVRDRMAVVPAAPCPTVRLGDETGVLKKLADKKHLRRHETKLQKSAPVVLRLLTKSEEIKKALPDFMRQQILRRELLAETSSCLRPEFAGLLHGLAEEVDLLPYLRFFVLEWEGKPLAYHLGFEANRKFTMYQQTFNVDAWDYSAGEILMRQLFLYAADRVTREFDFSVGEEFYKNRFANHFKPNFTAYIEGPGVSGTMRRLYRTVQGKLVRPASKLKQAIRERSKIYRVIKYARVWTAESSLLLRRAQAANGLPHSDCTGTDVQVKEGLFADLAGLHLECPRFRLATKLPAYKQRLKRGDKIYIVRQNGRPALLAWVQKPSTTPKGDSAQNLIYDWVFLEKRRDSASYEALTSFLVNLK